MNDIIDTTTTTTTVTAITPPLLTPPPEEPEPELLPLLSSPSPLSLVDSRSLSLDARVPPLASSPSSTSCSPSFRVYATCNQGGRKYMEDTFSVCCRASNESPNQSSFVYLAIFDGHGGDMAANYAKDHLCQNIIGQQSFWCSDDDQQVCNAITKGFLQTHSDMMKEVVKWPKTASGLPSTSGTTASIVFIMNGKYYTGHVGDSRIVLGRKNADTGKWLPYSLTLDHKPESPFERKRIKAAGGKVMNKSGVDRVVWYRPKSQHKGPIRRSTSFDQIPFLAVARSLGDLWSFNPVLNTFIVSPEPDVKCIPIHPNDKCLLLASDGLWNMMMTHTSIKIVQEVEEKKYSPELIDALFDQNQEQSLSPSQALVDFCLYRWFQSRFRADNTTVLTVMIDQNDDENSENKCDKSDGVVSPLLSNESISCFVNNDDNDDSNVYEHCLAQNNRVSLIESETKTTIVLKSVNSDTDSDSNFIDV